MADRRRLINAARYMNLAFSFGTSMAISIFLGYFGGSWLDRRLGTGPVFLVTGMLLGSGLAFYNLFQELQVIGKPWNDDSREDGPRDDS